jgi:hypothetical protein
MPEGIDLDEVVAEFGEYIPHANEEVQDWIYEESELDEHTTPLTKVKGEYPVFSEAADHVVQEFTSEWSALGEVKFFAKRLRAFRQKVNFEFKPWTVLGSWMAHLHREKLQAEDMPISIFIMGKLRSKVGEDISILEGTGTYTPGTGLFGDSMDGIVTVLADMLVNGNPYKIPLVALTNANIVEQVTRFEQMIPTKLLDKIPKIFMSKKNKNRYMLAYEEEFKNKANYNDEEKLTTRLENLPIVGLKCMNGSDLIFCTPKENFLQLMDVNQPGEISDVQKFNYLLKIFMEWVLGYNFWVDEMVCVGDIGGLTVGLGTHHTLRYPAESTVPLAT